MLIKPTTSQWRSLAHEVDVGGGAAGPVLRSLNVEPELSGSIDTHRALSLHMLTVTSSKARADIHTHVHTVPKVWGGPYLDRLVML